MLTLGSLFDGIGGFPLAGIHNGITPLWASELEPFSIKVTQARFPDMVHVGDITKLDGGKLPPVDVICGGSPCQDLSVAGKRRGLAGERSGLFMDQIRIVKEMRGADAGRGIPDHLSRPRYLVWENVPGAFSSAGGEDFRAVIEEIVRIKDSTCHVPRPDTGRWGPAGAAILGTGFSLAWRVLDAQYWGVAQRRRRIFLVADLGGLTAPKILFEQGGLPGHPPQGRGTGQGITGTVKGGAADTGGGTIRIPENEEIWAFHINQIEETIDLQGISGALMATTNMQMQTFIAEKPRAGYPLPEAHKETGGDIVPKAEKASESCCNPGHIIDREIRDGGNGLGAFAAGFCGNAGETRGIGFQAECSPTLKTGHPPSVLCLNDQGGSQMHPTENVTGTLRAQEHGHQPLILANQSVLFENHGIDARYSGPHEVAPTMSAHYGTGGDNVPLIAKASESYCISGNILDRETQNGGNGLGIHKETAYTLTGTDRHAVFSQPVRAGKRIRRLTPLECERLQGFPDGWTDIPGASDSARYKALGNSVAIPCVDFVLRGIAYFLNREGT